MTATYLSSAELRELTGCAHRARQQKWLDRNRWPYAIAETGHGCMRVSGLRMPE